MCEKLQGSTDRCIISFVDLYEKTKRNFPGIKEVSPSDQQFIAQSFSRIAFENGMRVETCAEKEDLSPWGVENAPCVNRAVIEKAAGIHLKKHVGTQSLREHCACLPTHDMGAYNSCPHLCRYCYANYDAALVQRNYARHNPESSFLLGEAKEGDILKAAPQKLFRDDQIFLF